MYRKELDSLISKNRIPNNLMFYGNLFFMNYYEKIILNQFKDFDILKLYFDEYDFEVAKNHLIQSSLFGNKNLLIIKTDKTISQLKELIKLNKDNYLFLFFYGDKPNTKPFGKNFARFFEPKEYEKEKFVTKFFSDKSIKLDYSTIHYISKRVDFDNFFLELEKLSLLEDFSFEKIDKILISNNEKSFDEFFDILLLKQDFLPQAKYMIEKGEDPLNIILSLSRYLKNLYLYYLHIKVTGESTMKSFFGFTPPKDVEERRNRIVLSMNESKFLELFDLLSDVELELKNSGDKESLFFSFILNFVYKL